MSSNTDPDRVESLTPEQVVANDQIAIRERRKSDGRAACAAGDQYEYPPREAPHVGLAISGGGIRSATFALGVLEGLKQLRLLKGIDYLSTVSGGGYIGAWLSANCVRHRQRERAAAAPESWLDVADWRESIAHLRRYSNYLSPRLGFFSADTWSMFTIWLRNAMLVQATVVFAIACVLLLTRLAIAPLEHWGEWGGFRGFATACFVMAVAGIAFNLRRLSLGGKDERAPGAPTSGLWIALWATLGTTALVKGYAKMLETGVDVFGHRPVPLWSSFIVSVLFVSAGYALMPLVVAVVNRLRSSHDDASQIDYTQSNVQWGVVLPLLGTGLMMASALWDQVKFGEHLHADIGYGQLLELQMDHWSLPLSLALATLWLLARCTLSLKHPNPEIEITSKSAGRWRRLCLVCLAPVPAALVLYLELCGILLLMLGWRLDDPQSAPWLALLWGPPLVLFAFSVAVVTLIGMLGRSALEGTREWWSRLGAWLLIYGAAWMIVALAAVYGPRVVGALLDGAAGYSSSALLLWLATTGAGLIAGRSGDTGKAENGRGDRPTSSKLKESLALIAPYVFIAGLLILIATLLHVLILNLSCICDACDWRWNDLLVPHWRYMGEQDWLVVAEMIAVCGVVAALLSWRVDINVFSLNVFYRNRLTRCYLGASRLDRNQRDPQNFTGFDDADDLPMTQLAKEAAGPLHIVNCALNLGGSSDLSLHSRHGGSFIITPCFTGSGYEPLDSRMNQGKIGYRPTENYGGNALYPTLGQAISVSGAAASPNMGFHTSPSVAFLLTMFNARLGWWFPNPRLPSKRSSPRFSLRYLMCELFGIADHDRPFLNVSDGGHFENLGAYELIRRRCGVIIISDAECDPDLKFEGLAQLIRMCEVDFDVRIDIDVSAIRRRGDSPWSANRCAVGTITYPDAPKGTLIYLKASMTGRENEAILQYHATHADFPHESTGNQFYGEAQFESYRHLGREIVDQAFKHVADLVGDRHDGWRRMAERMRAIMAPALSTVAQFSRHGQTLMDLWARLGSTIDLKLLDQATESQVARDWPDADVPDAYRAVYFLCNQILQLMENVYLDLDLESTWEHPDNAGWRATFQDWVRRPVLRRTWALNHAAFGARFRFFCLSRLGMDEHGGLDVQQVARLRH